jgi:peptidoglycan/LPS O-acetylase OafA/YrhL
MIKLFKLDIDRNRIFGLDILRALAILFVVTGHGSSLLPDNLNAISDYFVFDGVSIFFVLSGFLIGGILIKLIDKNDFNFPVLKTFWIRRWFRTLPSYFLILISLCIIHLYLDEKFTLISVYRYFLFSQNIFTDHPSWFFPEAWSLSVEEWFYLIFPLLLFFTFLLKIPHKKSLLYLALFIILFSTTFRFYRFLNVDITTIDEWGLLFRKQVITRLDSLMFGVVGAYISFYHNSLWNKFKTQLIIIGISIFISWKYILPNFTAFDGIYSCVFKFTLISIGTLCMLPYLSNVKTGNGFLYKIITYISLISYSMYLLNLSIVQFLIIRKIPWNYITENDCIVVLSNYFGYWLLVIGLSILMYKYFEIPMTALRDRFKQ